jgi:hypothetical protein
VGFGVFREEERNDEDRLIDGVNVVFVTGTPLVAPARPKRFINDRLLKRRASRLLNLSKYTVEFP